jgi:hypothetical protein
MGFDRGNFALSALVKEVRTLELMEGKLTRRHSPLRLLSLATRDEDSIADVGNDNVVLRNFCRLDDGNNSCLPMFE